MAELVFWGKALRLQPPISVKRRISKPGSSVETPSWTGQGWEGADSQ